MDKLDRLPDSARLKLDLMFDGLRYSAALGRAATHAFPNYYPYRFSAGEHDPTGKGMAAIPYLMSLGDGTLVRIKGNGDSPWQAHGDLQQGYSLRRDDTDGPAIEFAPLPDWMQGRTRDGFAMARAGVSLHGDMAVVNVAPGCEYFLAPKVAGRSMRCVFCSYGAPDERTAHLGQQPGRVDLPALTYERLAETLRRALDETEIRHIYLVGGSLTDWNDEARRFIELASQVRRVNSERVPTACGSGALPVAALQTLREQDLVEHVCFNLEVWSQQLFEQVCPGKTRYVGYQKWLDSLYAAVDLWGSGQVYSAMVAGVELEPEYGLSWEAAADLAIEGAEHLCQRGVIPVYSLYWPLGGRDHPQYFNRLRSYFSRLNLATHEIRRRHGLSIADSFMCHRCAYMQLECDIDRGNDNADA